VYGVLLEGRVEALIKAKEDYDRVWSLLDDQGIPAVSEDGFKLTLKDRLIIYMEEK